MRILVTGATGFIGRLVVDKLYNLGYEVIATATRKMADAKEVIPHFSELVYIPKDLNDREENYFSFFENPDALIHLSWEGLPNYKELFHIERNLPANYYFIKNMVEHGLKDITVVGTCFEYGLQNGCLREDMDTRPVTNYGLAKDTLRKFIQCLQNTYRFSFKWLRLFYPYGSGQGAKSLYTQLEKALESKSSHFDMSAGEQLRDYLPVHTMAEYITKLALQNKEQGIINCCSGKPVSVRNFVETFFREHNYTITLNLGVYPYPDYEPFAFWGDASKMLKAVGEI